MRSIFATLAVCMALSGCTTMHGVGGRMHDFVYGPPTTFIVFFPDKSAELTPEAADIVNTAAGQIARQRPATVQIAAGVAPGGNMEMSQPRFAAVRQRLVADGVAEDLIARSSIPDPKLDTGPARQRVEIRLLAKGP